MSDIIVQKSNIVGTFSSPLIGNYSGDYSFAGMFLARAALNSSIVCDNLNPSSEQNGTVVMDILKGFGARVTRAGNSVNVRAHKLRGCRADISEFPQISPVIALLALFATGKTRISGFKNAPDLQLLIYGNLRTLGARCELGDDDLWIWPQRSLDYSVLDAKNHPYMALALILIATATPGETVVRNVDGLLSRYPQFEEIFTHLGGVCTVGESCVL